MDDEDEVEGLLFLHAIEDEHGLDGEVPGPRTVGRGHDDGKVGHHKRDEGATQA